MSLCYPKLGLNSTDQSFSSVGDQYCLSRQSPTWPYCPRDYYLYQEPGFISAREPLTATVRDSYLCKEPLPSDPLLRDSLLCRDQLDSLCRQPLLSARQPFRVDPALQAYRQQNDDLLLMNQQLRTENALLSQSSSWNMVEKNAAANGMDQLNSIVIDAEKEVRVLREQLAYESAISHQLKEENVLLAREKTQFEHDKKDLLLEVERLKVANEALLAERKRVEAREQKVEQTLRLAEQMRKERDMALHQKRVAQHEAKEKLNAAKGEVAKMGNYLQQIAALKQQMKYMAGQNRRLNALYNYSEDKLREATGKGSGQGAGRKNSQEPRHERRRNSPQPRQRARKVVRSKTGEELGEEPALRFVLSFLRMVESVFGEQLEGLSLERQLELGWELVCRALREAEEKEGSDSCSDVI